MQTESWKKPIFQGFDADDELQPASVASPTEDKSRRSSTSKSHSRSFVTYFMHRGGRPCDEKEVGNIRNVVQPDLQIG